MDKKLSLMRDKALEVMHKAYAPYSKFHVGACLITEDGSYFTGCNCENASYGLTQCAEASVIGAMVSAGHRKIASIYIIGSGPTLCTPCGACRQRILEFSMPKTTVCMASAVGDYKQVCLSDLIPMPFKVTVD